MPKRQKEAKTMSETENTHQELHNHGQNMDRLLENMPCENEFVKACDIFQQLSDPTRLRILWLLAHSEQCVNNISLAIDMSTSAVSHHLRGLRQTGLLVNRRAGKEVYYKLSSDKTAQLIHKMIDDVFEMNCPRQTIS